MDLSPKTTITFSTHNVNGYKRSKEFLYSQCDSNPNSIYAIQEHWLRPPYKKQFGVNQLRCLHPDFDGYGTSAMTKSNDSKLATGRPYGGTGYLFNKKFSNCLKPLLNYSHERVTVLELTTSSDRIILINCYFPFYNSRDMENYVTLYKDTVGFIDNVMHQNRDCKFILLADFNCDIRDRNHRYARLIHPLMAKYMLVSAYDLVDGFDYTTAYTRYDSKTSSYTLIDGILISADLKPLVSRVCISHCGDNVSDHVPVVMDMSLQIAESCCNQQRIPRYVNWKKLTTAQKLSFKNKMSESLSAIHIPQELNHGIKCCSDDTHKFMLEQYYMEIVSAISEAESVLPQVNPNSQKSYWNDELGDLKRSSVECGNQWKSLGCPRSGPAFECWKRCHFSYKSAIRKSKADREKAYNEAMLDDMTSKDGVAFWQKWNSVNKVGNLISSRINGETDEQNIANESKILLFA